MAQKRSYNLEEIEERSERERGGEYVINETWQTFRRLASLIRVDELARSNACFEKS